jgi:hypothetical protein
MCCGRSLGIYDSRSAPLMRFPLSFYWTIAAAGAVGVGVWEAYNFFIAL